MREQHSRLQRRPKTPRHRSQATTRTLRHPTPAPLGHHLFPLSWEGNDPKRDIFIPLLDPIELANSHELNLHDPILNRSVNPSFNPLHRTNHPHLPYMSRTVQVCTVDPGVPMHLHSIVERTMGRAASLYYLDSRREITFSTRPRCIRGVGPRTNEYNGEFNRSVYTRLYWMGCHLAGFFGNVLGLGESLYGSNSITSIAIPKIYKIINAQIRDHRTK
jgi:hypothetical protein